MVRGFPSLLKGHGQQLLTGPAVNRKPVRCLKPPNGPSGFRPCLSIGFPRFISQIGEPLLKLSDGRIAKLRPVKGLHFFDHDGGVKSDLRTIEELFQPLPLKTICRQFVDERIPLTGAARAWHKQHQKDIEGEAETSCQLEQFSVHHSQIPAPLWFLRANRHSSGFCRNPHFFRT